MMALVLVVLAQAQSLNLNAQPVIVLDEGVRQGTARAVVVNCSGAGVTCTQSGTTWTLAVSGGGGGGTPTVSCVAGEALTWNGSAWSCTSSVTTASRLSLSCVSGDFVTCNGTTCSCATPSGGGGGLTAAQVQRLVAIGGP